MKGEELLTLEIGAFYYCFMEDKPHTIIKVLNRCPELKLFSIIGYTVIHIKDSSLGYNHTWHSPTNWFLFRKFKYKKITNKKMIKKLKLKCLQ